MYIMEEESVYGILIMKGFFFCIYVWVVRFLNDVKLVCFLILNDFFYFLINMEKIN